MKRRLFLKTGSVSVGGMLALPTVLYGCATVDPFTPQGPAVGVSLFKDSSRLFDSSIAELRLAGNGSLAGAESEDVTLAGTGSGEADLIDVAQQITNKKAAIPAELAEDFAESSADLIDAAGSLVESAHEIFPIESSLSAELAEDYAHLKVTKASSVLASAAMAVPLPMRKVSAAEKMISSAELVFSAMHAESEPDLIESTEELLAHSEEYVGSAEQFSARSAFIEGVKTFRGSVVLLAEKQLTAGATDLMTSTDNIALSSGYYADGINNLNAEAEYFGGSQITSAKEFIPYAAQLVAAAPLFQKAAQGESAELGAGKMAEGAAELLKHSQSEVANLGIGGQVLDIGADQFIGGEITYSSAQTYSQNSAIYYNAAEDFGNSSSAEAEAEFIHETTEQLLPASEIFLGGAESLQAITQTDGVESLVPAATEILTGAQLLEKFATSPESLFGVENMISGAEQALAGASESISNPAEYLETGANSVELGTVIIMNGAAEFVEGYN